MKHFLFRILLMSMAVSVIVPVDVNNVLKDITVASSGKESSIIFKIYICQNSNFRYHMLGSWSVLS